MNDDNKPDKNEIGQFGGPGLVIKPAAGSSVEPSLGANAVQPSSQQMPTASGVTGSVPNTRVEDVISLPHDQAMNTSSNVSQPFTGNHSTQPTNLATGQPFTDSTRQTSMTPPPFNQSVDNQAGIASNGPGSFQAPITSQGDGSGLPPVGQSAGLNSSGNNPSASLMGAQPITPVKPIRNKLISKKLILIGAILFLLIGGGAGAYFGYIVPNRPENVWKSAMSNTTKGYDKLLEIQDSNKDKKTVKVDSNFEIKSKEVGASVNGSFTSQSNATKSKSNFEVSMLGAKLSIDVMSNLAELKDDSALYVRLNGIDGLLQNSPSLSGVAKTANNQWFMIDKSTITDASNKDLSEVNNKLDVSDIVNKVGDSAKKYVLTDDSTTSVFDASEFVGKEDVDGRKQYHYKVGANKDNLKKFVKDLAEGVESTNTYKDIMGDYQKPIFNDQISKEIDGIDDKSKVDVWVDAKTKLIRKIKISYGDDKKSFTEIGLNYDGGNKLPFYVKLYEQGDDGGEGQLNLILNSDNMDIDFNFKMQSNDKSKDTVGELTGKVTFSNEDVEIDVPKDAKSLKDLFDGSYLNPSRLHEDGLDVLGAYDIRTEDTTLGNIRLMASEVMRELRLRQQSND